MADLFWLSDAQWTAIEPFMPKDQPGPERKDDRQVISGILHVITSGWAAASQIELSKASGRDAGHDAARRIGRSEAALRRFVL